MEETNKKGELLKRIEAEATGLDGKINDRALSVPIDTVRNSLVEAIREITNHLKMADEKTQVKMSGIKSAIDCLMNGSKSGFRKNYDEKGSLDFLYSFTRNLSYILQIS